MRKLFISDIHGCFNEMAWLLQAVNYEPANDQLVVGGDLIDRGPQSGLVVKQLKKLEDRYPNNVKVLMGNHEHMMGMFIADASDMWLEHGGIEAMASFEQTFTQEEYMRHAEWLIRLPIIHTDDEYVYVHAGINPDYSLVGQVRTEVLWMPYHEENGTRFDEYPHHEVLNRTNKRKVVYGHTPKPYVFDDGARICCDLGAATRDDGSLALVDLTNDRVYYTPIGVNQVKSRKIARRRES